MLLREGMREVPQMAAQREEYLEYAMNGYRSYTRKGGDTLMAAALYGVSDAEVRALAHFLANHR